MAEKFEYTIVVNLPDGYKPVTKERLLQFCGVVEFAARIFAVKNNEYGDAIKYTGVRGATYELIGGISRLHYLVNKSTTTELGAWLESIGDTLLDILNYAVIGSIMLGDNNIDGKF